MSIKDWKNGRRLTDSTALKEIKDMFFAVDPITGEVSNDELMEVEWKRNQSKINQAR